MNYKYASMFGHRGVSLVEVLLAVVLFAMAFLPIMRLFSGTGLSQQRMIRDYPIALNIAERVLNTIENEIKVGRFDISEFESSDLEGVDITSIIEPNASVAAALERFVGQDPSSSTQLIRSYQIFLRAANTDFAHLYEITVRFRWTDLISDESFRHEIVLSTFMNRI